MSMRQVDPTAPLKSHTNSKSPTNVASPETVAKSPNTQTISPVIFSEPRPLKTVNESGYAKGASMEEDSEVERVVPRGSSSILKNSGVDLMMHKLSLTTYYRSGIRIKEKKILKGVSGILKKGTVTAIMGPSGSVGLLTI